MANQKRGHKASKRNALWLGKPGRIGHVIALIVIVGALAVTGGVLLERALAKHESTSTVPQLLISEVMPENRQTLITDTGEVPDWIEIYNAGDTGVQLRGWSLLLSSNVAQPFVFPEAELMPGEYALVYADGGMGKWSAPWRLNASGGDTLELMDPAARTADAVELMELRPDESCVRDGNGEWVRSEAPSPGSAVAQVRNEEQSAGAVEITEIMSGNSLYCPDEDGEYCDYVELHNTTSRSVNLTGWTLSDDAARLKRWIFPSVTLGADGYMLVRCSGKDRVVDADWLHTNFRLSSEGEQVYLCDAGGHTVSHVSVPALMQDQAWSRFGDEWNTELAPTPGLENSRNAAAHVQQERFGAALSGVHLNEIMASAMSEDYDWIELYNSGAQAVDLSGWGLSDDSARPRRWQFPQGNVLQPGAYLGIFLTGDASITAGGNLSADFALSAAGRYTVCLSDPQGRVQDAVYLGTQYGGIPYARFDDSEGFRYGAQSTPLLANGSGGYLDRAAPAQVSVPGGLYTSGESFTVELSAPAGSRIYYTIDCNDPDESSTLYTEPITVNSTTVLRSRVYRDDCLPSLIDTQSYLYDVRNESGVYVVSLVTDRANIESADSLLSPDNLMEDIEREAHVEIFTPDGATAVSNGCGISLHGADSRKQPIKSFNVMARSEYGDNRFRYPLFSHRDYSEYQSLLLRPSGEDQNMSFMRDSVLTSLMRDTSVMFQENEACVVYLDGEYYTLCYLRERINKYSICQFEGWVGMEDSIDIIRGNSTVTQGSNESFVELLEWVKAHDMTTTEAYAYVDARIDINNYIEYMAAEIYSGNLDLLNVRRYRNPRTDGKWRWALFDLDWAFFNDSDTMTNWLRPGGAGVNNTTDNTLFIACMKNPSFRDQFLTRFGELLATNFSSEYVYAAFRQRYEFIEPMLDQYRQKWNYDLSGLSRVASYAQTRPQKMMGYIRDALKLSDAEMQKYFGAAMQKALEYEETNK